MEGTSRLRFVSLTFLVGFGVGSFVGVLLGIVAISFFLEDSDASDSNSALISASDTPTPPPNATPTPVQPKTNAVLQVRLGPGEAYAIIGTTSRGDRIDVVGRDTNSQWLAIRFPTGSTGRGWIPLDGVEGLTGVERLTVAMPTPLPRTVQTPVTASGSSSGAGSSGGSTVTSPVPGSTSGATVGPAVTPSPTPRPGPTDLNVIRLSLLSDGRISVVVGNRGPGDAVARVIGVVIRTATGSEFIEAPVTLLSGGTTTLTSRTVIVTEITEVSATLDPFNNFNDPERGNNTLTVPLGAPPSAPNQ